MDPTSLERLAALKRTLPKKLPLPDQASDQASDHKPDGRPPVGRHPLETTQDPEHLFGELMNASPDGHVPSHLLKRLRGLEQQRAKGAGAQAEATNGDEDVNRQQEQYSLFEALLGDEED